MSRSFFSSVSKKVLTWIFRDNIIQDIFRIKGVWCMKLAIVENYQLEIIVFLLICTGILLLITLSNWMTISTMRSRYARMMSGKNGENIERMLLNHSEKFQDLLSEFRKQQDDIKYLDSHIKTALTRVGIVRFSAFEDVGSDLSYAVALLDEHNNGLILTSIFSRADARSYVKPIENGQSQYKLMDEEVAALREAMQGGR